MAACYFFITLFFQGTATAFPIPDRLGWGARAIGMGGAFTGVADDPTATYYNPAGLVQIDGHAMVMGYIMQIPNIRLNDSLYIDKATKGPMVSIILDPCRPWNIKRRVRIGLSAFFPDNMKSIVKVRYGHDYDPWYPLYGDSSLQNFLASQVGGAIEIFPWLYFGGGFSFNISGSNIQLNMIANDQPMLDFLSGTLKFPIPTFDGDMKWDFTSETRGIVGVLLKPLPDLRIGFTWRKEQLNPFEGGLPINIKMYSIQMDMMIPNAVIEAIPLLGATFPIQIVSNSDYSPQQYALGVSYQLNEKLLLSLDVTYYDYTTYVDDAGRSPVVQLKGVYVPRFGLEYYLLDDVALRFGYGYEPSPVRPQPQQTDAWVNFMDNDTHEFGFGIGYTGYSISDKYPVEFSFYYQLCHLVPRTLRNVHFGELPLTFTSKGQIHSLGLEMKIIF